MAENTPNIAKALAHPLRAQILRRLGERVSSPGELSDELGEPLGVVSYHVRMLRDYNCVELVRTEPRRGALQHFYKAVARPSLDEAEWRTLPVSLQAQLAGGVLQEIVTSYREAAEADDSHVAAAHRLTVELDEKGEKQLERVVERFVRDVDTIGASASARSSTTSPYEIGMVRFQRKPIEG